MLESLNSNCSHITDCSSPKTKDYPIIEVPKTFRYPQNSLKNSLGKPKKLIAEEEMLRQLSKGEYCFKKINDYKEGYLNKKSKSVLINWKAKYCKIEHSQFYIFKDYKMKLLSEYLNFRRINPILKYNSDTCTFTIIVTMDKKFRFKTKNEEELFDWLDAIEYNIRITKDIPKVFPTINYYWKVY